MLFFCVSFSLSCLITPCDTKFQFKIIVRSSVDRFIMKKLTFVLDRVLVLKIIVLRPKKLTWKWDWNFYEEPGSQLPYYIFFGLKMINRSERNWELRVFFVTWHLNEPLEGCVFVDFCNLFTHFCSIIQIFLRIGLQSSMIGFFSFQIRHGLTEEFRQK